MTDQLALDFERLAGEGRIVPSGEVDKPIARLYGRGWQTARKLGALTESEKRSLRAITEESEGPITSGQRGYKLTIRGSAACTARPYTFCGCN